MLESLIPSKTARKVLTLFVTNPNEKFYTRQLERLTKEPVSAVRRELQKLERAGFLLSSGGVHVKYYWINKSYPLFEEVRNIILKTQGLGSHLKELIKKTRGIKAAFIYGSVAKGEEQTTSDID